MHNSLCCTSSTMYLTGHVPPCCCVHAFAMRTPLPLAGQGCLNDRDSTTAHTLNDPASYSWHTLHRWPHTPTNCLSLSSSLTLAPVLLASAQECHKGSQTPPQHNCGHFTAPCITPDNVKRGAGTTGTEMGI